MRKSNIRKTEKERKKKKKRKRVKKKKRKRVNKKKKKVKKPPIITKQRPFLPWNKTKVARFRKFIQIIKAV